MRPGEPVGVTPPLRCETLCPGGGQRRGNAVLTEALFIPPVSHVQGLKLNGCFLR